VNYPTNTIENDGDVSLIKQLSFYDVEGSAGNYLRLLIVFFVICFLLYCNVWLINYFFFQF